MQMPWMMSATNARFLVNRAADVADPDAVALADRFDRGLVAFLGPEVVQQAEHKADDGADGGADAEREGRIAVLGQQLGQDHQRQHVADQRAEAAGAGQGRTLGVIVGHGAQQRAHGDVEHGVAAFVQDLAEEQHDQQRGALEEGGHGPERDGGHAEQRRNAQQPGAELAVLVVVFGVDLIHQDAHERVVDSVPDIPDEQQNGQHRVIDLQHVGVVARDHRAHQRKGHAAAQVAARIADLMLDAQFVFGGGRCHGLIPP